MSRWSENIFTKRKKKLWLKRDLVRKENKKKNVDLTKQRIKDRNGGMEILG